MKNKTGSIISGNKKFFTPRSAAVILINIFVVLLLFYGIRKLFLTSEGQRAMTQAKESVKKEAPIQKVPQEGEADTAKKEDLLPLMPKTEDSIPIKAYKVATIDYSDELPSVGSVKNIPAIDLKYEINGVINTLSVKEADIVKKGDVLVSLDDKDINLEIGWSQAKLNSAEAEHKAMLKRYSVIKKLYETGAIIKDRLDQAQAEVDVAKAKIEISRKELELSQNKREKIFLKAPAAGIIGKKEKNVGEFITPNDIILTLIDPDNVFVEVGIIERDAFKIKSGQKVKINVDTYPTRVFFGYIETVFPEIDERTRTVNVRIRVLDPGKLLKPGMFARADIAVFTKREAIVVPSSSVSIQQGAYYAAVAKEDKVDYQQVSVEYITTDYAVIKKGIEVGDLIVVETPGMKKLAPGTGIKIIEIQEKLF